MSGVAKDENPSNDVADVTAADNPGAAPKETVAAAIADDAAETAKPREGDTVVKLNPEKSSARKAHLRVVADNQPIIPAPATIEAPSQRMGVVLRQAREALGYDLDQVSKETRITVSHLKAIEDMTPNLIGEPVYVKGHVRTYARHLKLDADAVLERYLKESAILTDPRKVDMAPPKVDRRMPVALPVLGILILALAIGGGAFVVLSNNGQQPAAAPVAKGSAPVTPGSTVASLSPTASTSTGPAVQGTTDTLRIVALRRARLEVRGANGDSYRARYFSPGESYAPRVGAGWTVTTPDGSAFEWRRGDVSLGLLAPQGPVYAQSVDSALQREAIGGDTPDPAAPAPAPSASAGLPDANAPLVASPRPAGSAAAPKPVAPRPRVPAAAPPATGSATPPAQQHASPAPSPAPSKDPALAAYPDQ